MKAKVSRKGNIVSITTDKHKPFTEENLIKAIDNSINFALELRRKWNNDDWFPCGFCWLKVDSSSPLIHFIKKNGTQADKRYFYKGIVVRKAYDIGYHIDISSAFLQEDAITAQCMRYKQRIHEKLQEELAYLGIRAELKTMID